MQFICQYCGKKVNGGGSFKIHVIYCKCNPNASKYNIYMTQEKRLKLKLANLNNLKNINFLKFEIKGYDIIYTYQCENCGDQFQTNKRIKNGRKIHCDNCKQKRPHKKNINEITSIYQLSSRTRKKIMKKMDIGCYICGWKQASLDTHHIVYKSQQGGDEHSNLINICPNCHRIIHTTNKFSKQFLKKITIQKNQYFQNNWKKFYCNDSKK